MTLPIAFPNLPRVKADEMADTPPIQKRLAPAVDANFAKIDTYAGGFSTPYMVKRVSGSSLVTFASGWTYYSGAGQGTEGWKIGDLRVITFIAKRTGAAINSQDMYGGLNPDVTMATITNTDFVPGGSQDMCVGACTSGGVCSVVVTYTGAVVLIAFGSSQQTLATNGWVAFTIPFLRRV